MNYYPTIDHPKISIITPSLNQGQFIEKTIRSVLSQDYPNLEYIIMDGGSSDNTLAILNSYSDRLKWVSEKDNGQTQAINKGLRMADGDIVAYLNADDLLIPGTLARIAQLFVDMPNVMWMTGRCHIIDERDREIRHLLTNYKNFWLHINSQTMLLVMDYISQPATFWRASLFPEMGYLDEDLHYVMDYEYWLRLYEKYPPLFVNEYFASFRVHTRSKTTSTGHKNVFVEEEKAIIQKYTNSRWLLFLHNVHRMLMTTVYSTINKE